MVITQMHIVILAVVFVLILFLIAGVLVRSSRQSRLETEQDFITELLAKRQEMLRCAGLKISARSYILTIGFLTVLISIIAFLLSENILISIVALAAMLLLPRLAVEYVAGKNSKAFEERYARSLKQLASSLSAGRSILQSVDDVANCKYVNERLRKEYMSMSNSLRLGIPVTKAFQNFADNVESKDAKDVALAIEVQNEIGGHEVETILEIANNIQERILLRKEIKTIFSSTASMVKIMNFVVPACMFVFALTNISYIETYFSSPVMIITFCVLVALPVLGIYLTNRTMKNIQPKD